MLIHEGHMHAKVATRATSYLGVSAIPPTISIDGSVVCQIHRSTASKSNGSAVSDDGIVLGDSETVMGLLLSTILCKGVLSVFQPRGK